MVPAGAGQRLCPASSPHPRRHRKGSCSTSQAGPSNLARVSPARASRTQVPRAPLEWHPLLSSPLTIQLTKSPGPAAPLLGWEPCPTDRPLGAARVARCPAPGEGGGEQLCSSPRDPRAAPGNEGHSGSSAGSLRFHARTTDLLSQLFWHSWTSKLPAPPLSQSPSQAIAACTGNQPPFHPTWWETAVPVPAFSCRPARFVP